MLAIDSNVEQQKSLESVTVTVSHNNSGPLTRSDENQRWASRKKTGAEAQMNKTLQANIQKNKFGQA